MLLLGITEREVGVADLCGKSYRYLVLVTCSAVQAPGIHPIPLLVRTICLWYWCTTVSGSLEVALQSVHKGTI